MITKHHKHIHSVFMILVSYAQEKKNDLGDVLQTILVGVKTGYLLN